MPIYEFTCQDCGARFEELVRSSGESENIACVLCRSKSIVLALSTFGFASKDRSGQVTRRHASGSSCSGCHSHNCGHCH